MGSDIVAICDSHRFLENINHFEALEKRYLADAKNTNWYLVAGAVALIAAALFQSYTLLLLGLMMIPLAYHSCMSVFDQGVYLSDSRLNLQTPITENRQITEVQNDKGVKFIFVVGDIALEPFPKVIALPSVIDQSITYEDQTVTVVGIKGGFSDALTENIAARHFEAYGRGLQTASDSRTTRISLRIDHRLTERVPLVDIFNGIANYVDEKITLPLHVRLVFPKEKTDGYFKPLETLIPEREQL